MLNSNTNFAIRKYFCPLQPSVSRAQGLIDYQEFRPVLQLDPLIHCYWQLRTVKPLATPFNYRVVSDGCVDIFFNVREPRDSFLMGFCKKFTTFPIGTDFHFAGIRFYPAIFPYLFGISAKMLRDKDQPLREFLPGIADFIQREIQGDFEAQLPKFNSRFSTVAEQNKSPLDERFYNALLEILRKQGNLATERDLNTGISPRQLRRLFNFYIGTTPKSFSQVVRFQHILNASTSTGYLKDNKIYFDLGFFDQAHFIKNFTRHYGVTPAKAFG